MTEPTPYLPDSITSNITIVASFCFGYTKNIIDPIVVIVAVNPFTKDIYNPDLLNGIITSLITICWWKAHSLRCEMDSLSLIISYVCIVL